MKIAVIGGASSYTPELIDGLYARLSAIPANEVWMMDPNAARLEITSGLARRMGARHKAPFAIHATPDMRQAVEGAKYVITQIRVGGMQARIADEKLGLRHGIIGQETTGIGGFACALRTIPRILEVAHAMESLAPDGILLNFTNPAGIVTEAVLKHSTVTTVGLCNIPIGMIMEVAKSTGAPMESIDLDYVGLNHLAWVRAFRVAGKDLTKKTLAHLIEIAGEEWTVEESCREMQIAMRALGMYCNPYLQYFYATQAMLEHLRSGNRTRGEEVIELEKSLFEKYRQPTLDKKPEELSKRGGAHYSTAAFHLINAIENDLGNTQIVCCRNNGAIPTFDDDVAVEVPALIGRGGANAIPQRAPEPAIRGLMQSIKAYESLTVQAAVTGDKDTAFLAMLEHPLMPGAAQSKPLLEELLEVNRPFLEGTFFKSAALPKARRTAAVV